jgi:hypothetical protein
VRIVAYIIIETAVLVQLDLLSLSISLVGLKVSELVTGSTGDFFVIVFAHDEVVVNSLYDLLY